MPFLTGKPKITVIFETPQQQYTIHCGQAIRYYDPFPGTKVPEIDFTLAPRWVL